MFPLLVVLLTLAATVCSAGDLPVSEIAALKTLYASTNGPKWRKNKWPAKLDGDPCKWAGVTCKTIKDTRHVVSLSHEHTYAGGQLPAALADLTEVELLDLGSNELTGPIPKELGQLKNVFQIEADGNHFTGTIPTELEALISLTSKGFNHRKRSGATAGGARFFLGFNKHPNGKFGFECPYPEWLNKENPTQTPGSTVATSFGLMKECGLKDKDATPDEEDIPGGSKEEEFGQQDEGNEKGEEGEDDGGDGGDEEGKDEGNEL